MDGVLIDSEPLHIRLEKQIFKELGFTITDAEHEGFLGTSGYEMFTQLKKKFCLDQSVEDLLNDERRRYIDQLRIDGVPFVQGIPELIEKLHQSGMKLALASSAPHDQIDLVVSTQFSFEQTSPEQSGNCLTDYFQVTVSGDDVERSKPDPAIFIETANLLAVEPEECWVIEDSENGITAALAAGMPTLAFENPGSPPQDLSRADHIITNMNEAAAIILG